MRSSIAVLILLVFGVPASASLEIMPLDVLEDPLPSSNDFLAELTSLGLDRLVQGNVKITANGTLSFFAHASESAFTNTFSVGGFSFTEYSDISWDAAGTLINLTPISVTAGMLLSDAVLNAQFTTNGAGGLDAKPNEDGFGIFANEAGDGSTITGPYSRLYFGYDDNGAGPDDNHDDLIISVVFTPAAVPEPGAFIVWGGLALLGSLVSRRR